MVHVRVRGLVRKVRADLYFKRRRARSRLQRDNGTEKTRQIIDIDTNLDQKTWTLHHNDLNDAN